MTSATLDSPATTSAEPPVDAEKKRLAEAKMEWVVKHAEARRNGIQLSNTDTIKARAKELATSAAWFYRMVNETVSAIEANLEVTWEDFLSKEHSGGAGKSRLDDKIEKAMSSAILDVHMCGKHRPGKKGFTGAVKKRMEEILKIKEIEVSPKTVAQRTKSIVARREVDTINQRALESTCGPLRNRAGFDWTQHDNESTNAINVLADPTGSTDEKPRILGVANLTCGIEEVTLVPWSWLWCVGKPTLELVPECVLHGTISKLPLSHLYNLCIPASFAGKPVTLSFPSEIPPSRELTACLAKPEIKIHTETRSIPNPRLDTIASYLYERFTEYLTKTSDRRRELKGLSAQQNVQGASQLCIYWSDLEQEWATWIFHHYLKQPNKRLAEATPEMRYHAFAGKDGDGKTPTETGKPLPEGIECRIPYLPEHKRIFRKAGIEIRNRFYSDPILKKWFDRDLCNSDKAHSVWTITGNVREVWVINFDNPKEYISIPMVLRGNTTFFGKTEWDWNDYWRVNKPVPVADNPDLKSALPAPEIGSPPLPSPPSPVISVVESVKQPTIPLESKLSELPPAPPAPAISFPVLPMRNARRL